MTGGRHVREFGEKHNPSASSEPLGHAMIRSGGVD
jgi:hypothetical protein